MKKLTYIFRIIILFITLTIIFSNTIAHSYYIDATNGIDSNNGLSPSFAWKTISKLQQSVINPGDSVNFKCGEIWNETLYLASGSTQDYIIYGSYDNGNKPLIRNLVVDNCSYSKLIGIKFNSTGYIYPVFVTNSHHIKFLECDVIAAVDCTQWVALYLLNNCNYIEISKCNIQHLNLNIQADALSLALNTNYNLIKDNFIGTATHFSLALMGCTSQYPTYTSNYNVIKNNHIENHQGAIFGMISSAHFNLVESNLFIGGKSSSFNVNSARSFKCVTKNNIIRNNIIRDNSDPYAYGLGMEVYQYQNYPPNIASDNHIYNNIITNISRAAFTLANYMPQAGCKVINNHSKNNIVYNNGTNHQLTIWDHANIEKNFFISNIFYKSGINKIIKYKTNVYDVKGFESMDSLHFFKNIQKDPKLDSNLHPLPDSPCIDAGDHLTMILNNDGTYQTLKVKDAGYFCDGFGIISGDQLIINNEIVYINSIDYSNNTISLNQPIFVRYGTPVNLRHNGSKPDIGVYESPFGIPKNPTQLRFD